MSPLLSVPAEGLPEGALSIGASTDGIGLLRINDGRSIFTIELTVDELRGLAAMATAAADAIAFVGAPNIVSIFRRK